MDTFVVRIWRVADDPVAVAATDRKLPLRGIARHVASGAETAFADANELIALLEPIASADIAQRQPAIGSGMSKGESF